MTSRLSGIVVFALLSAQSFAGGVLYDTVLQEIYCTWSGDSPFPPKGHFQRGAHRGHKFYRLDVPDGTLSENLTPAALSYLVAGAEAAHQDGKSALHKAADNALIAVLIRGNLVPAGTTELSAGTTDAITAQMLASEVADPTNETIQVLSSKLARLQDIIEKEGGDPDDAVIH